MEICPSWVRPTTRQNNPGWLLCPGYEAGGWQWCLNDGANNIDVNGEDDSINDGAWHNFVLTVDRTAKVANSYLEGMLLASKDIASLGNLDTGLPITIGQDPTGTYPEPVPNTLDDLGIWKRALTAAEVTQIYSAGITGGNSFDTIGNETIAPSITQQPASLTVEEGLSATFTVTAAGTTAQLPMGTRTTLCR